MCLKAIFLFLVSTVLNWISFSEYLSDLTLLASLKADALPYVSLLSTIKAYTVTENYLDRTFDVIQLVVDDVPDLSLRHHVHDFPHIAIR